MKLEKSGILNKPAFKSLSLSKQEAIRQLINKIEGKSGVEAVVAVVSHLNTMPKTEAFSKEEQRLIVYAILEDLPKEEKTKMINIIKMVSGEEF